MNNDKISLCVPKLACLAPGLRRQGREGRGPKGAEPFLKETGRNGRLRSNALLELSLWLCTQQGGCMGEDGPRS